MSSISTSDRWRRPFAAILLPTLLGLSLVACGEGDRIGTATPGASLVQESWTPFGGALTALAPTSNETYEPLYREIETLDPNHEGVADLSVADDRSSLQFTADAGDSVVATSLAETEDIDVTYRASDSRLVVGVVGKIVEAGGTVQGRAEFFLDGDADGIVVASDLEETVEENPTPSSGARWVSITTGGSGDAYVLDLRNFRVLRLVDQTGDGVPDTVSQTVFLDSTQTHEIQHVRALVFDPENGCLDLHRHSLHMPIQSRFMRVRDTDSDGRADEYEMIAPWVPRDLRGTPAVGDTQLPIVGPEQHAFEIWSVDPATGSNLTLLGSGTHAAGQTLSVVSISPALTAGQHVRLRDVTSGVDAKAVPVQSNAIEVVSGSPQTLVAGTGGSVTLEGRGFQAGMSVRILYPPVPDPNHDQTQISDVSLTVTNAREASFVLPAMTVPRAGMARVMLIQAGEAVAAFRIRLTR